MGQGAAPTRSGFSIAPYLWMSSLSGTTGVGPLATNIDLSFGDIVKKLNFGAMATGAYRRDPWVAYVDGIYVSLSDAAAVAFRGDTGRFFLTQRETIIQPMGGYTLHAGSVAIDVLGGFRYWKLSTSLDVERSRRSTNTVRSAAPDWFDALAGVAAHWRASELLHFTVGGDGGGGGSQGTWQAYGSLGYDAWQKVSLNAAYRTLSVSYEHNNLLFDTDTRGFVIGVTVHF
jgi:hypothetical protein